MNKCLRCNKEAKNKFCSRVCYYLSRRNVKRPKHAEVIKQKLLGHKVSQLTKNKIGLANTVFLSLEEEKLLSQVLSWGYVYDNSALKKHAQLKISDRVLSRYKKQLGPYLGIKHLPLFIQSWPKNKWDSLLVDLKIKESALLLKLYNLSKKTLCRILSFYCLPWISMPPGGIRQETKIEEQLRIFFDLQGIIYKQEFSLGIYYYDFKIGNFLIEANGDFWHCNPLLYSQPICQTQKHNLINDARKLFFAQQQGYKVIYIWEYDLKHKPKETFNQLLELLNE
jgi:G:T-mismatch repair DNA endonuclease (very short patch repair protein)